MVTYFRLCNSPNKIDIYPVTFHFSKKKEKKISVLSFSAHKTPIIGAPFIICRNSLEVI